MTSLASKKITGTCRGIFLTEATNTSGDFVLDYLPPYSPELNPIERVWKLTRRQCLHNRYFPALEEVITAVETEFGRWGHGKETLRRLCAIT